MISEEFHMHNMVKFSMFLARSSEHGACILARSVVTRPLALSPFVLSPSQSVSLSPSYTFALPCNLKHVYKHALLAQ